MSQNWTDDVFAGGHVGQTDLQNMENNFACLKSMFSGGSAPSNAIAGMPWFDTTQKVLKYRDSANAAWLGLMHGDTNQKVWIYRDSTMDGWAIDSAVSDIVLAIKGGATYTTGGVIAGNWAQPGHTHTIPNHYHTLPMGYRAGNSGLWVDQNHTSGTVYTQYGYALAADSGDSNTIALITYTDGGGGATSSDGTPDAWRPAAAVGTLQYLDL